MNISLNTSPSKPAQGDQIRQRRSPTGSTCTRVFSSALCCPVLLTCSVILKTDFSFIFPSDPIALLSPSGRIGPVPFVRGRQSLRVLHEQCLPPGQSDPSCVPARCILGCCASWQHGGREIRPHLWMLLQLLVAGTAPQLDFQLHAM